MGTSAFKQFFPADFTGIDAEGSAIEADGTEVSRALNYERAFSNNLRGRTGRQLVGSPGGFFGLHSHSYGRVLPAYQLKFSTTDPKLQSTLLPQTGETVTEVLGFNRQIFRLGTLSPKITIVTPGTYSWYSYFASNGNTFFKITSGAGTILDYDCGTGLEVPGTVGGLRTIYDLLVAIDATAALAVTFDRTNIGPFAISSASGTRPAGGMSDVGQGYNFLVSAGYTYQYNDPIVFWDTQIRGLVGGFYSLDIGATNFEVVCPTQPGLLTGQVIGYLGQPAASFPIDVVQSSAVDFTLNFPCWFWVPTPIKAVSTSLGPFEFARTAAAAKQTYSHYKPPSFLSQNGNCYIAATDYAVGTYTGTVYKYDTQSMYAAGWPTPPILTRGAGTAAAHVLAAGTYRYKYFYRRRDSQGNIIESNPCPELTYTSTGAANSAALLTIPVSQFVANPREWFHCYTKNATNTTQVIGAATGGPISVSSRTAAGARVILNIGDPVYFIDSTGIPRRSYITQIDQSGATYTIIYIADQNAFSIINHTMISCGVTAVILRTTAGNNQFYLVKEIPLAYYAWASLAVTWEDCSAGFTGTANMGTDTPDTALVSGEQYLEIEIGREHDAPPRSTLLCEHQGLAIYTSDPTKPNTVSYSLPGEPEYVPLAANNLDIPSTQQGQITAVASDDINHLAVFKERAYYDVQGDLDSGAIDVQVKTEGDFGITSHASLKRVGSRLLGLSHLGVIQIAGGFLDTQIARKMNARIIGQPWYPQWAVATNDAGTRSYVLAIPTAIDIYGNLSSATFVIDYSRPGLAFLEQNFASGFNPSGGMAAQGADLFAVSGDKVGGLSNNPVGVASRRIRRFIGNSPTGNDGECFADGGAAISYVLEKQINFGEPHLFKIPIRLRVDSIPNDYIAEGWVPFSMLIQTGIFPDVTYIGSGQPGGISNTITFSNSGTWYQDAKLNPVKCLVFMLRLTTAAQKTAPFLTGYEILFKDAYAKEDLPKP